MKCCAYVSELKTNIFYTQEHLEMVAGIIFRYVRRMSCLLINIADYMSAFINNISQQQIKRISTFLDK